MELTLALYELLVAVDHKTMTLTPPSPTAVADKQHLYAMDPICDFLYHIKYMFVGDGVRAEAERSIRRLVR
jgi:mediator of RNA polymerase II transcription subunit 23